MEIKMVVKREGESRRKDEFAERLIEDFSKQLSDRGYKVALYAESEDKVFHSTVLDSSAAWDFRAVAALGKAVTRDRLSLEPEDFWRMDIDDVIDRIMEADSEQ